MTPEASPRFLILYDPRVPIIGMHPEGDPSVAWAAENSGFLSGLMREASETWRRARDDASARSYALTVARAFAASFPDRGAEVRLARVVAWSPPGLGGRREPTKVRKIPLPDVSVVPEAPAAPVVRVPVPLPARPRAVLPVVEELLPEPVRPRTRGECVGGLRPCPWVSCRHHLYLDVQEGNWKTGSVKLNFPSIDPEDMHLMKNTCSLDVADEGEQVLDGVGEAMNLTRERTRQIEENVLGKLRKKDKRGAMLEALAEGGFDRGMSPLASAAHGSRGGAGGGSDEEETVSFSCSRGMMVDQEQVYADRVWSTYERMMRYPAEKAGPDDPLEGGSSVEDLLEGGITGGGDGVPADEVPVFERLRDPEGQPAEERLLQGDGA